jgi:hypothetical protein
VGNDAPSATRTRAIMASPQCRVKEQIIKQHFRNLVNLYKGNQRPIPESIMDEFNKYRGRFTWTDIIDWTDHYGINGCVVFDENIGTISFNEYPAKPYKQITNIIEVLFTAQFRVPYLGQGGPQSMWVGDRSTDTILSLDICF